MEGCFGVVLIRKQEEEEEVIASLFSLENPTSGGDFLVEKCRRGDEERSE